MYKNFFKRLFDVICALAAITVFCWLYVLVAVSVRIKLGSPVIFAQKRPGKDGRIFTLYKFRTMTDARDEKGRLLPDSVRLTKFGKMLRATSLDELPEAFNILKGDMSVVGPRPQLVRDMVFMSQEQKRRHCVRPGLTGLAQISGRNAISWEEKLEYDLKYIENISFWGDVKIILKTVFKAFVKREDVVREGTETDMDFGDWLLSEEKIDKAYYDEQMKKSEELSEVQ